MINEAVKNDSGKHPLHLLPFDALLSVADVLKYGEKKYGSRNWEVGLAWSRVFAACLRHMFHWFMRSGSDEDSGHSHLAHAACNLLFLLAYELRQVGEDDRP